MELTAQDAPVGAAEGGVTERVADWIDGAVDVAEPITCKTNSKHRCTRTSDYRRALSARFLVPKLPYGSARRRRPLKQCGTKWKIYIITTFMH